MLRLINVIMGMAIYSHWNGCFQYMLATFEATWEFDAVNGNRTITFHPDSWVARMESDGTLNDANRWSWSYFIAICQMLAISVGLQDPKREIELWGYMVSILLGACLYGFFVASLTTAISEADASAKDYRTKLDMVNQYMRHSQLPRALRGKLRTYFELVFPSKRSFDEDGILSQISTPLRQEISLHKCRAVLSILQVLDTTTPGLAGAISQQLERVVYVGGDYIIRAGEEAEGMYFVSSGVVEVVSPSGDVIANLGASSFFGEMAMLNPDGRSVASVRVKTYCEGYRLSVESFEKVHFSYPSFKEYLESAAKLRLKHKDKASKDADLDHLFERMNPTKRKLNRMSICAQKGAAKALAAACSDSTPKPSILQRASSKAANSAVWAAGGARNSAAGNPRNSAAGNARNSRTSRAGTPCASKMPVECGATAEKVAVKPKGDPLATSSYEA